MKRSSRSVAAEARFRALLESAGAELLEPMWLGTGMSHKVRCTAGHICTPRPTNVLRGTGICIVCAGQDTASAEARFRARLAELGATMLGPWRGVDAPCKVRCANGHIRSPRPGPVTRGVKGLCAACAGDPANSEARFRARLTELGAELLEPKWLGVHKPHEVRCAAGHICAPHPNGVINRGDGICRDCASASLADISLKLPGSVAAEARFRSLLSELGAKMTEPRWLGTNRPHLVRCAAGHICTPTPNNVFRGQGICRGCGGNDPVAAEARFRAILAEHGAAMLEPYQGVHSAVRVRCANGHVCAPHPSGILSGGGICRTCAGKVWDVFYVVANPASHRIKFGITSGNPRKRLGDHRQYGYAQTIRLMTTLPRTVAADIERAVISALALAGAKPVLRREYYDSAYLPVVLDIADSYPVPAAVA